MRTLWTSRLYDDIVSRWVAYGWGEGSTTTKNAEVARGIEVMVGLIQWRGWLWFGFAWFFLIATLFSARVDSLFLFTFSWIACNICTARYTYLLFRKLKEK